MELNLNDISNLLKLLHRSTFEGMDEAEVGLVLKQKLVQMGQKLQERVEETEG